MDFYKKIPIGLQIKLDDHLIKWQRTFDETIIPQDGEGLVQQQNTSSIIQTDHGDLKHFNLDIAGLLNETLTGINIMRFYETNSILSNTLRNLLVSQMSQYLITNRIKMSTELAKNLANKVTALFPNEITGIYYFKQPGQNTRGKIYTSYYSHIKSVQTALKKKRNLLYTEVKKLKRIKTVQNDETSIAENLEEIFKDDCSWAEMEQHYAATSDYRVQEISQSDSTEEILQKWVQYKNPFGYKLIELDFNTIYPNTVSIEEKFGVFALHVCGVFEKKIKEKTARCIMADIQETKNISQNGSHAIVLYLLHFVLIPTTRLVKQKNGVCRVPVKESQKSFMLVGATAAHVNELLNERMTEHPQIVIQGSLNKPEEIFIYFDKIKYQVYSIVRAVELCFKIFYVFNLNFPTSSNLIWSFIKQFFFESMNNNARDTKHSTIDSLIEEINKQILLH